MTILTPHKAEKKLLNEEKQPQTQVADDFLISKSSVKSAKDGSITLVIESKPTLKRTVSSICIPLVAALLLITLMVGGIYLYKLLTYRTVRGFCKIPYYYEELSYIDDYSSVDNSVYQNVGGEHYGGSKHIRHTGIFEEMMELDIAENNFEKFDVPAFEDVMRASIVHDFQKNLSAIVDGENRDCFVMMLNRTLVQPPKDFWDLLNKLGDGYYFPDTEIIKTNYKPVVPPVQDLSRLGYHIWSSCKGYTTYLLREVKSNEPIAMVKRDVSSDERHYAIAPGRLIQKVIIQMLN